MEIDHGHDLQGVRGLVADLAGPWVDPWVLSGHGTPFQRQVAGFDDPGDAPSAVERALVTWAGAARPEVLLAVLAEIASRRPGHGASPPFPDALAEEWNQAVAAVVDATLQAHPGRADEVARSDRMRALRPFLPDEV